MLWSHISLRYLSDRQNRLAAAKIADGPSSYYAPPLSPRRKSLNFRRPLDARKPPDRDRLEALSG